MIQLAPTKEAVTRTILRIDFFLPMAVRALNDPLGAGFPGASRLPPRHQWQLEQLVLEQEAQPEELVEGVKSPLLLKAHADMRRSTFFPLQLGHVIESLLPKTSVSNWSLHFRHRYS
jgi:hypothetical protein